MQPDDVLSLGGYLRPISYAASKFYYIWARLLEVQAKILLVFLLYPLYQWQQGIADTNGMNPWVGCLIRQ